jgi:hypothetical protein
MMYLRWDKYCFSCCELAELRRRPPFGGLSSHMLRLLDGIKQTIRFQDMVNIVLK